MALALKYLYTNVFYFLEKSKDPRLDHYFLMGSPIKIIGLISFYLYFVNKLGPRIMENRKPFQINGLMSLYNISQVIFNGCFGFYGLYVLLTGGYDIKCITIDYSYSEKGLLEARLTYIYYMLKAIDLLDTVFFIMRKKYSQATFLHVYHHAGMCLMGYIFTRYLPGGHVAMLGIINCFVHTVMYTYYFLTAFKPELKTSIWWKKHITHIQMLQFLLLFVHFSHPLVCGNCSYPKFWLFFGALQSAFMFALFANFYVRTYIMKPRKKAID